MDLQADARAIVLGNKDSDLEVDGVNRSALSRHHHMTPSFLSLFPTLTLSSLEKAP